MVSDIERKSCPKCGSSNIGFKGYAPTSTGPVRLLRCKSCGYRFREKYCRRWRAYTLPDDLLESYQGRSLNDLCNELSKRGITVSHATLYYEIQRRLREVPSWRNFLYDEKLRERWTGIMGVDTTTVKISGKDYSYLHVVDSPSRVPLAYQLLQREKADLIESVLQEIKRAGYQPRIVVTDLAPELLSAVKKVFPNAPIQGCLYHLIRWLNKQLPTGRAEVKIKIFSAALATDQKERVNIIENLLQIGLTSTEMEVLSKFTERLTAGYYHTLTELAEINCPVKFLYNNICERAIGSVKEICARMRNFKNPDNAQHYVNHIWYRHIQQILQNPPSIRYWDCNDLIKQMLELVPKGLRDLIDMTELSKILKLPASDVGEIARTLGLLTTTRYAFSKGYLRRLRKRLSKEQPTTLKEASVVTGLDIQTLSELLPKLNLKLKFKTLDVSDIEIIYAHAREGDGNSIVENSKNQSLYQISLLSFLAKPYEHHKNQA